MQRSIVRTAHAPGAIGPYSQAVVVQIGEGKRMVFCSGQIALDPATGVIVEGDVDVHRGSLGSVPRWGHEAFDRGARSSRLDGAVSRRMHGAPLGWLVDRREQRFVDVVTYLRNL